MAVSMNGSIHQKYDARCQVVSSSQVPTGMILQTEMSTPLNGVRFQDANCLVAVVPSVAAV